ncbi:Galactosylgalactosylxylosylprotein 3-beta-glucuronosyltransferase S, partial [Armadillidium nasatum]
PEEDPSLPKIYVITPTYGRPEMIPELTRLGQSLLLVPRLHWIIAEDSYNCTDIIIDLLNSLGSPYTYLLSPMPKGYREKKGAKPKGVSNRRAALDWIKEHGNDQDVLYFLDDDNTVNVKLFDEIRFTKRVSMFPVGFIGDYRVSSPIVKKDKSLDFMIVGMVQKIAVDMGGFAVNVGFLREHVNATMPYMAGYEEDGFLKSLNISLNDIEPKAEICTKILVWHTKTSKNKPTSVNISKHTDDNIIGLVKNMKKLTVIK